MFNKIIILYSSITTKKHTHSKQPIIRGFRHTPDIIYLLIHFFLFYFGFLFSQTTFMLFLFAFLFEFNTANVCDWIAQNSCRNILLINICFYHYSVIKRVYCVIKLLLLYCRWFVYNFYIFLFIICINILIFALVAEDLHFITNFHWIFFIFFRLNIPNSIPYVSLIFASFSTLDLFHVLWSLSKG